MRKVLIANPAASGEIWVEVGWCQCILNHFFTAPSGGKALFLAHAHLDGINSTFQLLKADPSLCNPGAAGHIHLTIVAHV